MMPMDEEPTLFEPPPVDRGPAGRFALALGADLQRRRDAAPEAVPEVAAEMLGALADQIDALSNWLSRRPDAKPADRVALARLYAQFEGSYERTFGPARAADGPDLAGVFAALGGTEAGDAA